MGNDTWYYDSDLVGEDPYDPTDSGWGANGPEDGVNGWKIVDGSDSNDYHNLNIPIREICNNASLEVVIEQWWKDGGDWDFSSQYQNQSVLYPIGPICEVNISQFINNTSPTVAQDSDLDVDGLTYGEELLVGTDPFLSDSDGDSLNDAFEIQIGTDPNIYDSDYDSLSDFFEWTNGLNPLESDTDVDGVADGLEVKILCTDPLDEDSDGDGLLDGFEVKISYTDPTLFDTDGDTLSDKAEFNLHFNPFNSSVPELSQEQLNLMNVFDGDYQGENSFINQVEYSDPWGNNVQPEGTAYVNEFYENHSRVYQFDNAQRTYPTYISMDEDWTFETWIYPGQMNSSDTFNGTFGFTLDTNTGYRMGLRYNTETDSMERYNDGEGWDDIGYSDLSFTNSSWYVWRIDYDASTHAMVYKFDFDADGDYAESGRNVGYTTSALSLTNWNTIHTQGQVCLVRFSSLGEGYAPMYIDSPSFVSDESDYDSGDLYDSIDNIDVVANINNGTGSLDFVWTKATDVDLGIYYSDVPFTHPLDSTNESTFDDVIDGQINSSEWYIENTDFSQCSSTVGSVSNVANLSMSNLYLEDNWQDVTWDRIEPPGWTSDGICRVRTSGISPMTTKHLEIMDNDAWCEKELPSNVSEGEFSFSFSTSLDDTVSNERVFIAYLRSYTGSDLIEFRVNITGDTYITYFNGIYCSRHDENSLISVKIKFDMDSFNVYIWNDLKLEDISFNPNRRTINKIRFESKHADATSRIDNILMIGTYSGFIRTKNKALGTGYIDFYMGTGENSTCVIDPFGAFKITNDNLFVRWNLSDSWEQTTLSTTADHMYHVRIDFGNTEGYSRNWTLYVSSDDLITTNDKIGEYSIGGMPFNHLEFPLEKLPSYAATATFLKNITMTGERRIANYIGPFSGGFGSLHLDYSGTYYFCGIAIIDTMWVVATDVFEYTMHFREATFSFEEDEIGSEPDYWTIITQSNTTVAVLEQQSVHQWYSDLPFTPYYKAVTLSDSSNATSCAIQKTENAILKPEESFEYIIQTNNSYEESRVSLLNSTDDKYISLLISESLLWLCSDDLVYNTCIYIENDQLYHIRVSFEFMERIAHLWVNTEYVDSFNIGFTDQITTFRAETSDVSANYALTIDSIGLSWRGYTPFENIGNIMYSVELEGFADNTALESCSVGTSLQSLPNNTDQQMLVLNDTSSESIENFTVTTQAHRVSRMEFKIGSDKSDHVSIVTISNNELPNNDTIDFMDLFDTMDESRWIFYPSTSSTYFNIKEDIYNRTDILEIRAGGKLTTKDTISHYNDSLIDFWIATKNNSELFTVNVSPYISLQFNDTYCSTLYNGSYQSTGFRILPETFHHVTLDFGTNSSGDVTYNLWFDDLLAGNYLVNMSIWNDFNPLISDFDITVHNNGYSEIYLDDLLVKREFGVFKLKLFNNEWLVKTDGKWEQIHFTHTLDTVHWIPDYLYHVKMDLDCISQDVAIFVDNYFMGLWNFSQYAPWINTITFHTDLLDNDYSLYLDSFGYSIYDYDTDSDGLFDIEESVSGLDGYQTDVINRDSDLDTIWDGWESSMGLNPLNISDAVEDFDNDNATNALEYQARTDPYDNDTDNDDLCDGYEINYTNPLNPFDRDLDYDGDGWTNYEEFLMGTNCSSGDSDGDFCLDVWEVQFGLDPTNQDDGGMDTDQDGLVNYVECEWWTDPFSNDTDSDEMYDLYECNNSNGLIANVSDANGDVDQDGLTNLQEHNLWTCANNSDTDGDGLGDYWESVYMNPHIANDPSLDTDSDTLNSTLEEFYGTNSSNSDTDYDGMPDGYEIMWGHDPTDSSDADDDDDGDLLSNLNEYIQGTHPNVSDCDSDGLLDGWEVYGYNSTNSYTSDPWDNNSDTDNLDDYEELFDHATYQGHPEFDDFDGDGLNDDAELSTSNGYVTDPLEDDCDGDGLNDRSEIEALVVSGFYSDPWDSDTDNDGLLSDWMEVNGNGYNEPTDPDEIDTDNDGYSDKLEFQVKPYSSNTLNSYDTWITIAHKGGTGLSTTHNTNAFGSWTFHQDSSYGTYYNTRNDDSTEQYIKRDLSYNDGWMYQQINGYSKPTALSYQNDISHVRIDYEVMADREGSYHSMSDMKYRIYSSDGSEFGWYYIDSGAVSYGTWHDGYNNFYDTGLINDIAAGKYVKRIDVYVYVDGTWRTKWTRLWVDHLEVTYYLEEDC